LTPDTVTLVLGKKASEARFFLPPGEGKRIQKSNLLNLAGNFKQEYVDPHVGAFV
jgi:hypothetical protein